MKPMAPLAANVRLELTPSDSKSDVLPFTPIRYMWAARHSPFREFANALALPCSDYFRIFAESRFGVKQTNGKDSTQGCRH